MRRPAVRGVASKDCIWRSWMPGSGMRSLASVSHARPAPWKLGRTAGGARRWSGGPIARTRRWPKRPPCSYYQKNVGGLPSRRGRMTRLEDRQILVRDIEQACADGARLARACALAGIGAPTPRRWKTGDGLAQGDRRADADRPIPSHALSEAERARIIEVANEPRLPRRRQRG